MYVRSHYIVALTYYSMNNIFFRLLRGEHFVNTKYITGFSLLSWHYRFSLLIFFQMTLQIENKILMHSCHLSLSIPPEVFWCFQEVYIESSDMKCVNRFNPFVSPKYSFSTPSKHHVVRGERKGTLGTNGLII